MITKQHLSQSIARECDIIVHLFSKIAPDAYDYQPSPEQRTTAALLRYLTICASAGLHCMVEKDWKLFAGYSQRAKDMQPAEFPAAMERQKQEVLSFLESASDETLAREAPMPGGGMLPLGVAILEGPLKWLTAYKMQLFLYAKASGAPQLKTSNLWRGTDPKQ